MDGFFSALKYSSMEATADVVARTEFTDIAQHWPSDVRQSEADLTNEEEAADLVYNFLIPEVRLGFFSIY